MLASISVPMATTAVSNSPGAELAHGALVRRVGLDDVGEDAGELLDVLRVGVDAQHLVAHADEGLRETAAEAAQPDDDELPVCH